MKKRAWVVALLAVAVVGAATLLGDVGVGADRNKADRDKIDSNKGDGGGNKGDGGGGGDRARGDGPTRERGDSGGVRIGGELGARDPEPPAKADKPQAPRERPAPLREAPPKADVKRGGETKPDRVRDVGRDRPDRPDASGQATGRSASRSTPPRTEAKPSQAPATAMMTPAIPKPPFSSTPLGQILSPGQPLTDNARATPTKSSPAGGYAGPLRSGGNKYHFGLDDPAADPRTVETRYAGLSEGVVTQSGKAYTKDGEYLGYRVTVEFQTPEGKWSSKTMHHAEALVKVGDKVKPGDVVARGAGVGDQFKSPSAGGPHVHWETRFKDVLVDPLSGQVLKPAEARPRVAPAKR